MDMHAWMAMRLSMHKGMRIGIQMIQWMHGFYELMHWRLSYARI
jgi:hypothetical protein